MPGERNNKYIFSSPGIVNPVYNFATFCNSFMLTRKMSEMVSFGRFDFAQEKV